jgi:hypothetical protein
MALRVLMTVVALLAIPGHAYPQIGPTKVAYIMGNDLFVEDQQGRISRLTRDGFPKDMPLWSKDGSMVAFDRKVDAGSKALADIVVVRASDGAEVANIPVQPHLGGLRFVESIEWLTSSSIAVSGSIDPSTTEYITLALPKGEERDDYYDQGDGAAFSADGKHVAYIEGSPHFTPEAEREPNLQVDGKRFYPEQKVHMLFRSAPAWSPDGGRIAIVSQDYSTGKQSLVICALSGVCEAKAKLPGRLGPYQIFWDDQDLVLSAGSRTWSLAAADDYAHAAPMTSPSPLQLASEAKRNAQVRVRAAGGEFADEWCQNCIAARLPRRASLR